MDVTHETISRVISLWGDIHVLQSLLLVDNLPANWPNSHIPQCTCSISHNAPSRTEICTFLLWMGHCEIWNRCILGFVRLIYSKAVCRRSLFQTSCRKLVLGSCLAIGLDNGLSRIRCEAVVRINDELSSVGFMAVWNDDMSRSTCGTWLTLISPIVAYMRQWIGSASG